jgi:phosphohistidine phosphatase
MELYVIRHADAVNIGERNITADADRSLSDRGENQARAVGAALVAKGIRPAILVTSPLVRARQTADGIVSQFHDNPPALQQAGEVAPGFRRKDLAKYLRGLNAESIAVVGHEPDLSRWIAWVIGSKKAQIDFAKAGVALIHCPDDVRKGSGSLVWLLTPDWLDGAG